MIPDHPSGFANSSFLESLSRSNVTLNFDGIAEIVENGIITTTGVKCYHLMSLYTRPDFT
ncbi:hypothetical protein EV702DRAFT_1151616 [Suillus placidus]|uniref:Uncharacterized protein n=1 Tax=Suillus placidus TaxID=48579 RepID=A0A9P7CWI9_9AGAM|nr:hypothetical protein EV702DRAFT_1151616 [Suillus placidus]